MQNKQLKYHICLVCNGTGIHNNKPCEMCAKQWKSKRLETIYDLTKAYQQSDVVPLDPRGFLMFAGFDRGMNESVDSLPIGLVFEDFVVKNGEIISNG